MLVALCLPLALGCAAIPANGQSARSATMRSDCTRVPLATASQADGGTTGIAADPTVDNIRRAEQWVAAALKAFLPAPGAPSLRLESLRELEAQTDLAFAEIMFECRGYRAGTTPRDYADEHLLAAEEQIAYFQHSLSNEVVPMASQGQVSDLPAIRKVLRGVATQGRQDALFGLDSLADEARKIMVKALVEFSSTFTDKCYDQSFDADIALSIERQNEVEGTGINVQECAKRKFAVRPYVLYLFESCSLHGFGDWRTTWDLGQSKTVSPTVMEMQDFFHGKGDFKVDWGQNGVMYRTLGDMHLTRKDERDTTGNLLSRSYALAGTMTIGLISGGDKIARILQLTPAKKLGGTAQFNADVQYSEKPCKSVDDKPPPGD